LQWGDQPVGGAQAFAHQPAMPAIFRGERFAGFGGLPPGRDATMRHRDHGERRRRRRAERGHVELDKIDMLVLREMPRSRRPLPAPDAGPSHSQSSGKSGFDQR
jgi:hypothetical protein